jgi:hypothetical protein
VLEKMESAKNPLNIVILDACRNNPFARGSRSSASGLAQMEAPTGSIVAFATAPGAEAADGSAGNGLYTSHLLRNMATPGLKVEDVFKRTRVGVKQASGGRQIPWESTSLEGDFYFAQGSGGAVPVQAATPSNLDAEMWELVAESGKPSAYRAYLDKFPNGQHAAQARTLIAQADKAGPAAATSGQRSADPLRNSAAGPAGFSFSEEEAKMDRATPAGREAAFEQAMAALQCAPARRNGRVKLALDEPRGGLFTQALGARLRQAGMKVGPGGDYVVKGTVSALANPHRLLRVNEIAVNAAVTMSTPAGREVASTLSREESYAATDVTGAYNELVQVQASDVAKALVTQLCGQ